jgi:hypothetical protein
MVWAKNGTPDTLTSTGNILTISDMTANKFNVIMWHVSGSSSNTVNAQERFNNNSNAVYARRSSTNGTYASNVTAVSQNEINYTSNATMWSNAFNTQYVCSISGEEKLLISHGAFGGTAGATTAPERVELVAKFVPSPDVDITRVDTINDINGTGGNDGSGDMQIGDNISALGNDGVESITVQDGAVYYDTDLNKEYVLYNNTWTEV